jgi:tetratricopeptide (TPR) repeat protein
MIRFHRVLVIAALLAAGFGAALQAAEQGRLLGTVTDTDGAPLPDVQVTVTAPGFKYEQKKTSDKKGQFTVLVIDGTKQYQIKLEKEGYHPLEGPLRFKIGETIRQTYPLEKPQVQQPAVVPSGPQQLSGESQAINVYNEGVVAFQGGDVAGALAKFQQATDLDPKQAAAWGALADLQLEQKKYAEAAAAADKLVELEPANPRGLRARYDAYKGAGNREKSEEALEALAQGDPSRDTAIRIYNEGAEATRRNDTEAAGRYLKRSVEVDPTFEQAYSALTGLYLTRKNFKDAAALAEQWIARSPGNLEALTVRYEAYKGMGDNAKAKEALAAMSAADAGGTSETFFKQGVSLFNANNFAQAKAAFERVLSVEPNHAKAHYMLGLVYANASDQAKAKEFLTKFVKLAPNDPDAPAAKEMLEYLK